MTETVYCQICNRPLKNPKSREDHVGPVCRKKKGANKVLEPSPEQQRDAKANLNQEKGTITLKGTARRVNRR